MQHNRAILEQADRLAKHLDIEGMYRVLRGLPLADFCLLHHKVSKELPGLLSQIPTMPSDAIQKRWVGDSGIKLLHRSCGLLRLFDLCSFRATGAGLHNKSILDYGCGFGRLLRLMNYYAPTNKIVGVDAMQISLDICKDNGLHNLTKLVPARPEKSLLSEILEHRQFDFIYLFSVFSHTPTSITEEILLALREVSAPGALVVSTIRTIEWLDVRKAVWPLSLIIDVEDEYCSNGYSFIPLNANEGHLDQTAYGDTIMTPGFFGALAARCGWTISQIDRDLSEPYQLCVVLKKADIA